MLIIIRSTAVRFLASKNQFQLVILEFGDLGYQTGSFSSTVYANVGQLKVNNNRVMKLPAMFDQNPPHNLDQIVAKHVPMKNDLKP